MSAPATAPGDQAGIGTPSPSEQQPALCELCRAQPPKYRCPGCAARTCSLGCSRKHKQASGCTGKRKRTEFVPLPEFTERTLLADVHLLEGVRAACTAARRTQPPDPSVRLPKYLEAFLHQARVRGVQLTLQQPGMARRGANSSRWEGRPRRLLWRCEWEVAGTPLRLVNRQVPEDQSLREAFAPHLRLQPAQSPASHPLRALLADPEGIVYLLREPNSPAAQRLHHRLDGGQTLGSALRGRTIVEFPQLVVCLAGQLGQFALWDRGPPPRPVGAPMG